MKIRDLRSYALAETVELLVSELTTNAVNASAGAASSRTGGPLADGLPVIQLCLASDRRNVLVQVWASTGKGGLGDRDPSDNMSQQRATEQVYVPGGPGTLSTSYALHDAY